MVNEDDMYCNGANECPKGYQCKRRLSQSTTTPLWWFTPQYTKAEEYENCEYFQHNTDKK